MPDTVGIGAWPAAAVVMTRFERHTPSPLTTFEVEMQFAATHVPACSFWVALAQERQFNGPAAEQLSQLESQDWHCPVVTSKNWVEEHVGRQRPLMSTGRSAGQLVHWLNEPPLQLEQSGWQERHAPAEEKVAEGHVDTHCPLEAS